VNTTRIAGYLRSHAIPHALIGAVAMAARGHVRSTIDVNFMTTDEAVLRDRFWVSLRSEGATVDIRKGDFDDPLAGVVRVSLGDGTETEVVVGRYRWQRAIIERAEPVTVDGVSIPIPFAADLILLKLFAGGAQDVDDIRSLLDTGDRPSIVRDVGTHMRDLPDDAQQLWTEISAA
jgi:hypothetical protein